MARQMEHVLIPLDLFRIAVWCRPHRRHLEWGDQTCDVLGQTFCLSRSSKLIRFFTAVVSKHLAAARTHIFCFQTPLHFIYLLYFFLLLNKTTKNNKIHTTNSGIIKNLIFYTVTILIALPVPHATPNFGIHCVTASSAVYLQLEVSIWRCLL